MGLRRIFINAHIFIWVCSILASESLPINHALIIEVIDHVPELDAI